MRHRMLLAGALVYLAAATILGIAIDTRPPFWDMAVHAGWALDILHDFQQHGAAAIASIPHATGDYPPLYHMITAMFYGILGESLGAAQLANLPAIVIVALATYGIAKSVMNPEDAVIAAILVNFFPFALWLSRETVIDYWLTAMVAAAMWALIRSRAFSDTRYSLLFGTFAGLGMLTKWTFVLYAGVPAVWAARRNWKNAVKAAVAAALLAALWYVPQYAALADAWRTANAGAQNEGDPALFSVQALLFYVRLLESYQLFLPLFAVFLTGVVLLARGWRDTLPRWTPLILWLVGGWLGLMLIFNKDPRYSTPLLPAVAVIAAAPFAGRKSWQAALCGFLVLQHVMVSFGIPRLPETITLMKGPGGPVPFDWNLYSQNYFGLWGKPLREDWQIERVLQRVQGRPGRPTQLGMIPDLPRFDGSAFRFTANLKKYPVNVTRLAFFDEPSILKNDYLLMSVGKQGSVASFAPHGGEINNYLLAHPDQFHVIDSFTLPNGEDIRLYERER